MRWLGVGYRRQLAQWIATRPPEVECLEITAEHFFDQGETLLRDLRKHYPLFVHGLGLSLGTPGPLDRRTLDRYARVVELADPEWISEHVSFSHTDEVDLGHLNPLAATRENLSIVADHACEVVERCGKRLILENITSHLQIEGEMSEPEFLNRLCEKSSCGLLLDVTNLYINSKNHGFDPHAWLHELDPGWFVQLLVVGYSVENGRWQDLHAEPSQDDLRDLLQDVLDFAPVEAVIIERDANFPGPKEMARELRELSEVWNR